jgi:predicted nucleic acid-binding protein
LLDTNSLVAAAINPHSNSGMLVDEVREVWLRMIWNEATRAEAEYILRRILRLSWDEFASLFRESDRFDGKLSSEDQFDHVGDPADRKFAALADAANVVLVTNDAGLLESLERTSVRALRPGEFMHHCRG